MHNHGDGTRTRAGWLAPALLGAIAGPALQLQQEYLWSALAYTGWGAAALALLGGALALGASTFKAPKASKTAKTGKTRPVWLALSFSFVVATVLAFSLCGLRAAVFAAQRLAPALEGRDLEATGMVAAMPQRNEAGVRFRFEVESASDAGQPVTVPPQLYLGWYGGLAGTASGDLELQRVSPELRAGERWRMTVRLKAPHGNLNPHGFDYELWLWEQGVQASGYVRAGPRDPQAQRLAATWQHPVERARQAVRDAVYERIAERKVAGLLAALIVGDQAAIDRADWDVFRATGVAHLMSISGLHITMFAWLAALAAGWLWRRSPRLCLAFPAPTAALAAGVGLALAYALFSGWGVPAQRTVLMLATVGLLRAGGRRWPWPQVWLLACAVVVTVDPWALLQAGFWLSFVAVGVLFASDPAGPARTAQSTASPGRWARLFASLSAMWREQWVITVALTPLSLLLFGQVSAVGLLANALAIPWVTLVVTPLAMGGVLLPPLWDVAGLALQALAWFLQWLASWPFAVVSAPAAPWWAGAGGILGGVLLAMRLPFSLRLAGIPLMLPLLLWQAPRPAAGQFELLAADIGQGNAVIVRTANHTLVYDTGPRLSRETDAGHRVLVPLLRALGEQVDTVVLSHRDSDHTGGAPAVLAMQPQAALLSSIEDGHELQALRKAQRCVAGQQWQWDGVAFEILHPWPADYGGAPKPNALSCVLRISGGGRVALLVGDIERPQEERLVAWAAGLQTGTGQASPLRADVLLVPHHGSKTSSSASFLDAVQPRLAIVQAGYRNRFGHPAPPVLERYRERGIPVVASPQCGALRWASDDAAQVHCEREERRRYWHHQAAAR